MLTTNEITIVIRELCRLMEEYYKAPCEAKDAIYEDIVLLGKVIDPQPPETI